jgi:hypothetical protein
LIAIVVIESAQESRLMSNVKALLVAGAIAVIVITVKATQQTGTESANGLQMSLAHDETASGSDSALHFTVTFSNSEDHDVTFAPGILNCLKPPSKTSAIELNLTDDLGKRHRHLPYLGDGPPYQAMACGNMKAFVAVLHHGESLSLPLDIGKYLDLADSKGYADAKFPAGEYSLQAELRCMPSESSVPGTTHRTLTVSSNIVEVYFESEFAAPLDDYPRKSDAESRSPD